MTTLENRSVRPAVTTGPITGSTYTDPDARINVHSGLTRPLYPRVVDE
jgi:hypothetical protein